MSKIINPVIHLFDKGQATRKLPHYILLANYQNPKGAQWLGKKTQVPLLILPFTVGGSEQATDLASLYDEVISALTQVN